MVSRPSGNRATIPAKMIKEIPLPIPYAVICSPIHINKHVPAVRMMATTNTLRKSLFTKALFALRANAMPAACTKPRTTVP